MEDRSSLGCSKSGDDLFDIAKTLRSVVSGGPIERARTANGLFLRLHRTPDALEALRRFIAEEKVCCPFFAFDLKETATELSLSVEGPPEAGPLVDLLFRLADHPGAPA